jgi:hypothetical protein
VGLPAMLNAYSVVAAWGRTHNHHAVPLAVGNNDTIKIQDMFRF